MKTVRIEFEVANSEYEDSYSRKWWDNQLQKSNGWHTKDFRLYEKINGNGQKQWYAGFIPIHNPRIEVLDQ